MSAHTPGPWVIFDPKEHGDVPDEDYCEWPHVMSDDGDAICDMCSWGSVEFDEAEANARLIAAAPDLLAALKACLQSFAEMRGRKPSFVEDSIAMSKEAVAKATGGAV